MADIELIQGETFRSLMTITGLSQEPDRIEITWRNNTRNEEVKKWTLDDGITQLSSNAYAYHFTNLETLAFYGIGTWQVEIVADELGVDKSFFGTYKIKKATNITTETVAIVPTNFNVTQDINFEELTPTVITHNYNYFNSESLLHKTVPIAGLSRGDVVTHNMGGIVVARFVGTDLNEDKGVAFEYFTDNSVKIYPPLLGDILSDTTGYVQFTLLANGPKQAVIELTDAIDGQVITHSFVGSPVVGRFLEQDADDEDVYNETTAPYLRWYSTSSVTIQIPAKEGIPATFTGKLLLEKL